MRLNKKGFTLTELLIALGVIGILTAILLPVIMNMLPDQNALMAKRAYYATQSVVSDMINNDSCYPDMSDAVDANERRIGFDDGYARTNCTGWDSVEYNDDGTAKEGDACKKFITLFTNSLDTKSFTWDYGGVFTTRDGIEWHMQCRENLNSYKNNANANMAIFVDVNGSSKPNRCDSCTDSSSAPIFKHRTISMEKNKSSYDVFLMHVYANGRIDVVDIWAQNAIDVSSDITGDSDNEYGEYGYK